MILIDPPFQDAGIDVSARFIPIQVYIALAIAQWALVLACAVTVASGLSLLAIIGYREMREKEKIQNLRNMLKKILVVLAISVVFYGIIEIIKIYIDPYIEYVFL